MAVKQVIVVRTRYPDGKGGFFKPRTGKLIAQGAHASMKVFLDSGGEVHESYNPDLPPYCIDVFLTPQMAEWVNGKFTKICVRATSEEQLVALYQQAVDAGLPCALIEDAGATEFHGVPTKTCIAIGPADAAEIDRITGDLKLL